MIYYNENNEIISENDIDLSHGYLIDKDVEIISGTLEESHEEKIDLGDEQYLTYIKVDKKAVPDRKEVVSQIYIYTGPTIEEKREAQILYTALMTDTLLED